MKKLCTDICISGKSTIKTAEEYNIPLKTLENWIIAFNKDNHYFDFNNKYRNKYHSHGYLFRIDCKKN